MKRYLHVVQLLVLSVAVFFCTAADAVPGVVSFQGELTDVGGTPLEGSYRLVFTLYDALGIPVWSEVHDGVTVAGGVYTVQLGSGVIPLTSGMFTGSMSLGIAVGTDAANMDAEMTPRIALNSVGFAFRAGSVDPDAINGLAIANGSVGGVDVNGAEVQLRVAASCPPGESIRAIAQDGTVTCEVDDTGAAGNDPRLQSSTAGKVPRWDGTALVDGTMADDGSGVAIGPVTPAANLHVDGSRGVLFENTGGGGQIPREGAGTRMMWYPGKAAFRVGEVGSGPWDDAQVGQWSVAGGNNTEASGSGSTAFGYLTTAAGNMSLAAGLQSSAQGDQSIALGNNVTAGSYGETAIGLMNTPAPGTPDSWVSTDRLFVIGNGNAAPSDAMVVLKNGDTTINGNTTVNGTVTATSFSGDFSGLTFPDDSRTNELQDLGSSASGTDRTITITDGLSTTISVADNDNDDTNEYQDLGSSASGTDRTITITDGLSTTISVADNDNDDTNEYQNLGLSGTSVTITDGTGVDITRAVNLAETDPQVEATAANAVPRWNGTALVDGSMNDDGTGVAIGATIPMGHLTLGSDDSKIVFAEGADAVASIHYDGAGKVGGEKLLHVRSELAGAERDIMTVKLEGKVGIGTAEPATALDVNGTVTATGFLGDGSGLTLPDDSRTNELQNLGSSASGTDRTITITDGLSTTISVADNDNDPNNEKQTLSLSGPTLSISDGNSVGLSLGDHRATQTLNLNGNWLSGDGGAEGLFVDAAGKVGVGTSNPQGQLDVRGSLCLNNGTDCRSTWPVGSGSGAFTDAGTHAYYLGGNVGIGIPAPLAGLHVNSPAGILAEGTGGTQIPREGAGTRMMWFPPKSAFRAGGVDGTQWDNASLGQYSFAGGRNTTAGEYSTALGNGATAMNFSTALGDNAFADLYSTAMGTNTRAVGSSTAMGTGTGATGNFSTAMGSDTRATNDFATSMGDGSHASGISSTAMGHQTTAGQSYATAMGDGSQATGQWSTAMGHQTTAGQSFATAMGDGSQALGIVSTAMGAQTTAGGSFSTSMGYGTEAAGNNSTAVGLGTKALSYGETALGLYNTLVGGNPTSPLPTDRLFVIGNGNSSDRRDAMVVLKNGDTYVNGTLTATAFSGNLSESDPQVGSIGVNLVPRWDPSSGVSGALVGGSLYDNGSSIGLGTQNPAVTLDVAGPARVSGAGLPSTGYGLELSYSVASNMATIQSYNRSASAPGSLWLGVGRVGIGNTNFPAGFHVNSIDGVLFEGGAGGQIPAIGPGSRMMWYPNKSAFRVGSVDGNQWDDSNIGSESFAAGYDTTASGKNSVAFGALTTASSMAETAVGVQNTTVGGNPTAWVNTDRLFVIGNGFYTARDAVVVLKSGDTTINGNLTINGAVSALSYANLPDNSKTNELQNLGSTVSGTNRTITITEGLSTTIDVADNDNDPGDELQDLGSTVSGTNRTITITKGNSTTINVADNDNDSSNELQDLGLNGTSVTISKGGSSVDITSAVHLAERDPQVGTLSSGDVPRWNGTALVSGAISQDISGNVGIGVTPGGAKLEVAGDIRLSGGTDRHILLQDVANRLILGGGAQRPWGVSAEAENHVAFSTGGSERARVTNLGQLVVNSTSAGATYKFYVNGSAGGTQAWATSDARWKTDVETIDGALEGIDRIRGVRYRWKNGDAEETKGFDDRTHYGVIAQEMEEVFPELVDNPGDTDEYKHVEYNGLVGILVEAVKELKARNEALAVDTALLKEIVCGDHPDVPVCQERPGTGL